MGAAGAAGTAGACAHAKPMANMVVARAAIERFILVLCVSDNDVTSSINAARANLLTRAEKLARQALVLMV